MKLKKVTKHPCLKGLLWAFMYQKNDKHTSLRHSKALPQYKLQHRALICKSISLSRAEWLSKTTFHIPDPEQPPPEALWEAADIHSVQLQWHGRVSQSLPAATTAHKERGAAVLRTEALLQEAYTHTPAISLYPKPKVHQGTGQYFELLGSVCHYVESVHKRCQEQGCILNLPFAKKQKEVSVSMH